MQWRLLEVALQSEWWSGRPWHIETIVRTRSFLHNHYAWTTRCANHKELTFNTHRGQVVFQFRFHALFHPLSHVDCIRRLNSNTTSCVWSLYTKYTKWTMNNPRRQWRHITPIHFIHSLFVLLSHEGAWYRFLSCDSASGWTDRLLLAVCEEIRMVF